MVRWIPATGAWHTPRLRMKKMASRYEGYQRIYWITSYGQPTIGAPPVWTLGDKLKAPRLVKLTCSWLRHCATSRNSRVRFPMVSLEFWHYPSGHNLALWWTQPLKERQSSHRNVPITWKSDSLNLLQPSGSVQTCTGIVLLICFTMILSSHRTFDWLNQ